jgi:ketosteroid isomerase-like protein
MMKPEDVYPALVAAYNSGNLDAMAQLYDPAAVFVIKPGRVTKGPEELRAALGRLVGLGGSIAIQPRQSTRSGDVALVLGTYKLSGRRRDGSPVELGGRFADVVRLQPDGRWMLAVDNGFGGE